MIRHVVMFRWKADFSTDQREAWMDSVRALPKKIPTVRNLTVGADTIHSARSWDAAIVCEFDTRDDLTAYTEHPDHAPIIAVSAAGAENIVSVDFSLT